jgi:3'-5' exoribonuclease
MEAVILNFLDDLDSKINGLRTHIEREPDRDSSWTQYHRQYDRYFFKGVLENRTRPQANDNLQGNYEAKEKTPRETKQRSRFGNTLEEQLKSKKLDLLTGESQDVNDE